MHYTDTEKPASSLKKKKKKAGLAVLIKYTARDKFIFSAVQRAAGQVTLLSVQRRVLEDKSALPQH